MSLKALSWAMSTTIPRYAERLVLIVLAEHASGDSHETWPGIELIAREANLSDKTTRNALRSLVASGHIERVVNGAPQPKGVSTNRGRRNLYRVNVGWDESAPPTSGPGWDNPGSPGWDNPGSSGGQYRDETGDGTYISEPEEEPEGQKAALAAPLQPAQHVPELTTRQRAKRLLDAYWAWCRATYGRDPDIGAVALVRLLDTFLAQGVDDRRLGWAVRTLHEAGRPITRATIGAAVDGRGARQTRSDVASAVAAMRFDASGALLD